MSQLDQLESRWRALHEDLTNQSSYYSSSYTSWLNFGSSFINNVLINIHLKINGIHIRYEDSSTVSGCPFATGFVFDSLSITSTDEQWTPKFVTRETGGKDNLLFKLIEMESCSVYCDTDVQLFGELEFDHMVSAMRETMVKNFKANGDPAEHGYIIAPVNGRCYMKRNGSEMPLKRCDQPRTVIDVQLEKVPIMMTAIQYKHLLDWSLAFNTSKTLWRYRKWRPMLYVKDEKDGGEGLFNVRPKFNARIWWHFAMAANLEEYRQRRQRFNWHFLLQRCRDILAYNRAYLHYLLQPEMMSNEMNADKDRIEREFTLDEICPIREIVFNRCEAILRDQQREKMLATGQVGKQVEEEMKQQEQRQASSWNLPWYIWNYYTSQPLSPESPESPSTNSEESTLGMSTPTETSQGIPNSSTMDSFKECQENILDEDLAKAQKARQLVRTSSSRRRTTSSSTNTMDDIFLTRDAVFCQFNFQIHNSSFHLMAFNDNARKDEGGEDEHEAELTFMSAMSSTFNQTLQEDAYGNLLLEFEFTKMKVSFDITNPNAYSCLCHMNQGYRRRQQQQLMEVNTHYHQQQQQQTMFISQNELNQVQFNLGFECHNLNLVLLRAYDGIISDTEDTEKLATAQLTGCRLALVFSNASARIDGKLDSIEVVDLVTVPADGENKHKRVLSIGKKVGETAENDQQHLEVMTTPTTSNVQLVEKALSFSLTRAFSENQLRANIEMASFCYVHSPAFVSELHQCRECFAHVLEAYFSRAFKERVKAATTEMLRGIVDNADISAEATADGSIGVTINNESNNSQRMLQQHQQQAKLMQNKQRHRSGKASNAPGGISSAFIDNLNLKVFIRSPVIILPLSPTSYEVVVFHLGHMMLNNHNHSSDIPSSRRLKKVSSSQLFQQQPHQQLMSVNNRSHRYHHYYNAEIRDLSVYTLDCAKNVLQFKEEQLLVAKDDHDTAEVVTDLTIDNIPVENVYYCDMFGVPILQKTVIEIVLEKKYLIESQKKRKKKSSATDSTSSIDGNGSNSALFDGLNMISTVNSIDTLVVPKFSLKSHFIDNMLLPLSGGNGSSGFHQLPTSSVVKPELLLSVEISSIDVRFSYTDLLIFWNILNTINKVGEGNAAANNKQLPEDDNKRKQEPETEVDQEIEELCKEMGSLGGANTKEIDPEEFKLRLNKLQDLGFEFGESLKALAANDGNVVDAAYWLSAEKAGSDKKETSGDALSDQILSSDDNQSQCTSMSNEELFKFGDNCPGDPMSTSNTTAAADDEDGEAESTRKSAKQRRRLKKSLITSSASNKTLINTLTVLEVRIEGGSIRIIDDCNQLDIPLIELGVQDFRLIQQHTSPLVEASIVTNFYCDYYNSHLGGWEPFIEPGSVSISWKMHEQRCHLKSMLNTNAVLGQMRPAVPRRKLALRVDIKRMFNINVTRSLLDIVDKVTTTWVADMRQFMEANNDKTQAKQSLSFRQRQPFIPFALKNETGSDIHLSAVNKVFSLGKAADLVTPQDLCAEIEVPTNEMVHFDMVGQSQLQHQPISLQSSSMPYRWAQRTQSSTSGSGSGGGSSQTKIPQKIMVKVDGWKAAFPVSIERVGTFIRYISSERYFKGCAILVFDISLLPTAVKLITVHSALLITNKTTQRVELKFANAGQLNAPYFVEPGGTLPVPIKLLTARIQLRPVGLGAGGVCSAPIDWHHVRKCGEQHCSLQTCTPITHTSQASYSQSEAYVVTVLVERNTIGTLVESANLSASNGLVANGAAHGAVHGGGGLVPIASHQITLLPPLQISNRLPFELRYKLSNNAQAGGVIRSGEDHSVHYVNPLEAFNITFSLEHYAESKPIKISPGATKDYTHQVDLYDSEGRLLLLQAQVSIVTGSQQPCSAMTIAVFSPYWIINRSGLPLVFIQQGCSVEAAGQSAEHERARSISPLLFSFADPEAPSCARMRLGRMTDNMDPRWCNFFYLEKGAFYRRLRVVEHHRPPGAAAGGDRRKASQDTMSIEKIYEFGIDIRNGRDRYANTKIVTITPRYQIENLTNYKLDFGQQCSIEQEYFGERSGHSRTSSLNGPLENGGFQPSYMSSPSKSSALYHHHQRRSSSMSSTTGGGANMMIISSLPKSNMPFHWPHSDKPKLLCVRIGSIVGCLWSGSFAVGDEPSVSFHLNIRDDTGRSNFIRVEILLQNATYFIVFTDANSLPPPIRVENFSQVPIEFHQVGTTNSLLKTRVRPNSSVPYALDEPRQQPHLTITAPGGSSSTYDLNSNYQPRRALNYDNFYYLAFQHTFNQQQGLMSGSGVGSYIADLEDEDQMMMLMMLTRPDFCLADDNSQMLVFEVPDEDEFLDETKPVVMNRKERGKRSQLWRIDATTNRIIHEGSSPPIEPDAPAAGFEDFGLEVRLASGTAATSSTTTKRVRVLDVDDEDYPNRTIRLVIRAIEPQRLMSQTWHFTEDGRLRCAKYPELFVQPALCEDGATVFRTGLSIGLGQGPKVGGGEEAEVVVPVEQVISKQKMRKGSGRLNVSIHADGPSRVLRVKDNQMSANGQHLYYQHQQHQPFGSSMVAAGNTLSSSALTSGESSMMKLLKGTELELNVHLDSIGISVINKMNEEIIYLYMRRITVEAGLNPAECRLNAVVQYVQVDNQLRQYEKEVVLFVSNLESSATTTPGGSSSSFEGLDEVAAAANKEAMFMSPLSSLCPAINFNMHKLFIPNVQTNVFKVGNGLITIELLICLFVLSESPNDNSRPGGEHRRIGGTQAARIYQLRPC